MSEHTRNLLVVQHFQVQETPGGGKHVRFVSLDKEINEAFQRFSPWGHYRQQICLDWVGMFAARGLSIGDYDSTYQDSRFYHFRRRNSAPHSLPLTLRFRNERNRTAQEEAECELMHDTQRQYVIYVTPVASRRADLPQSCVVEMQNPRWIFEVRELEMLTHLFPPVLQPGYEHDFVENWCERSFARIFVRAIVTSERLAA